MRGTEPPRKRNYARSYFLMFTIHAVVSPYLQILIRGLGYSQAAIGLFLGIYEIAGIAGPLFIARIADARGRYRPAMFACAANMISALIPLALFPKPLVTALSLCLLALGVKTVVPLMDASFVTSLERAKVVGKKGIDYGVVRGIGSVGFVAVALILQSLPDGWMASPRIIALCAGSGVLLFASSLPSLGEPGSAVARDAPIPEKRRGFDAQFLIGLAVIALGRLAMAPVNSFFSLYLEEELKWNAVGGMWALSACAEIPMMLVAGKVLARTGPMGALALSSVGVALRLAIYAIFPTPAGAITGQLLHSLCYGLFQPAAIAFISIKFPTRERAAGMALFNGLGVGLPAFLGSALGGVIAETGGYRTLFASFVPFALASVALYFAFKKRLDQLR